MADSEGRGGGRGHRVKGRNIGGQYRAIFAKGVMSRKKGSKGKPTYHGRKAAAGALGGKGNGLSREQRIEAGREHARTALTAGKGNAVSAAVVASRKGHNRKAAELAKKAGVKPKTVQALATRPRGFDIDSMNRVTGHRFARSKVSWEAERRIDHRAQAVKKDQAAEAFGRRAAAYDRRSAKAPALDRARRIKAGQAKLAEFRAKRDAAYGGSLFDRPAPKAGPAPRAERIAAGRAKAAHHLRGGRGESLAAAVGAARDGRHPRAVHLARDAGVRADSVFALAKRRRGFSLDSADRLRGNYGPPRAPAALPAVNHSATRAQRLAAGRAVLARHGQDIDSARLAVSTLRAARTDRARYEAGEAGRKNAWASVAFSRSAKRTQRLDGQLQRDMRASAATERNLSEARRGVAAVRQRVSDRRRHGDPEHTARASAVTRATGAANRQARWDKLKAGDVISVGNGPAVIKRKNRKSITLESGARFTFDELFGR